MFLSTYFGSLWPENLDYQVDTYAGCRHYCYYCYVLNQAETDWTKEILIYNDITGQLSGELEKISPQKIYMGYYTDPYQPCEAEYRQTRIEAAIFSKDHPYWIQLRQDLLDIQEDRQLSLSIPL
jgi:DNA repair photolyase